MRAKCGTAAHRAAVVAAQCARRIPRRRLWPNCGDGCDNKGPLRPPRRKTFVLRGDRGVLAQYRPEIAPAASPPPPPSQFFSSNSLRAYNKQAGPAIASLPGARSANLVKRPRSKATPCRGAAWRGMRQVRAENVRAAGARVLVRAKGNRESAPANASIA